MLTKVLWLVRALVAIAISTPSRLHRVLGLLVFVIFGASPVWSQRIPDGDYACCMTVLVQVRNGVPISYSTELGTYKPESVGVRIAYAGKYAVMLIYPDGNTDLACNTWLGDYTRMGPPGSGGFCTEKGWR